MATWTWTSKSLEISINNFASSTGGTYIIAGTSGGIYYSTDAGVTWTASLSITDAVTGVASNTSGNIMYAVTGGYGLAYTSTDYGVSWSETATQPDTGGYPFFSGVCCNGAGTTVVVTSNELLGGSGAVYKSIDSGSTWNTPAALAGTAGVTGIACNSAGDTFVIVRSDGGATATNSDIYYSTDGITWTASTTGTQTYTSVACTSDGATFIACSSGVGGNTLGNIYTSTTPTTTGAWTTETASALPYAYVAISNNGANKYACVATGGSKGLYYKLDVGSWTLNTTTSTYAADAVCVHSGGIHNGSPLALGLVFTSGTGLYAATYPPPPATIWTWNSVSTSLGKTITNFASSSDGTYTIAGATDGVYYSTDTGVTWTASLSITDAVTGVASNSSGDIMYAVTGGASGLFYTSTNYGETWIANVQPTTSPTWYSGVCCSGGSTSITVVVSTNKLLGGSGAVYKSPTSGSTWNTPAALAGTAGVTGIACNSAGDTFVIVRSDGGATATNSDIYYSTDGITWTASTTGTQTYTSVACTSDGATFIACSSGVGGNTLGNIYTSTTPTTTAAWTNTGYNAPYAYVAISNDGTNLYACVATGPYSGLYYLLSGGSWNIDATSSTYTGTDAVSVYYAGANIGLPLALGTGSTNGIYNTYAPTAPWTWYSVSTSLGKTITNFASSSNGTYIIAGATDGVYYSKNAGVTWSKGGTVAAAVTGVASNTNGLVMYAVTGGASGSVYTSTDYGVTWTATATQPTTSPRWYSGVCCNGAGATVVVTTNLALGGLGETYKSTDSGATWGSAGTGLTAQNITGIACNSAGNKFVIVGSLDIYYSTTGTAWTASTTGTQTYTSVACTSDGATFIACTSGESVDATGNIYTSTTPTTTGAWTLESAADLPYVYVAISNNGANKYACVATGPFAGLYYSLNGGNWVRDSSTIVTVNAVYINRAITAGRPQALGTNDTYGIYTTYPRICFREGSKILCFIDGKEMYVPVETIRPGTLVKTSLDGYKKVDMIGHSKIYNPGHTLRGKDRLYTCTKANYPEIIEDLIITGCHSILVRDLTEKQRNDIISFVGCTFVTDRKYRLVACLDDRAVPYTKEGIHTIWHFALEHNDYYMNYGVYANGLLVETTSKRMMKELSGMELM